MDEDVEYILRTSIPNPKITSQDCDVKFVRLMAVGTPKPAQAAKAEVSYSLTASNIQPTVIKTVFGKNLSIAVLTNSLDDFLQVGSRLSTVGGSHLC